MPPWWGGQGGLSVPGLSTSPNPHFYFSLQTQEEMMLSLPRLLDSLPLSIGRGCSLSWPQEVTPGQSPRCSSGCSCEDGGISGGFPGLSKRKVFLLLRPQKGTRQRQGKRILPSQPSCVRWTLSQTHPFPNVQGGGAHITSLGPKAAEFLIPEGSKDIFQGNFFSFVIKPH